MAARRLGSAGSRSVSLSARLSLGATVRVDPLLNGEAVFRGRAPRDVAQNHDCYLYGE